MEEKNLICIGCPLGCTILVRLQEAQIIEIKGNSCPRGASYARKELTNPTRVVTSSVRVKGANGDIKMVSCKTSCDIPKDKIWPVVKALKDTVVSSPVRMGDVLIKNIADSGADILATKNMEI